LTQANLWVKGARGGGKIGDVKFNQLPLNILTLVQSNAGGEPIKLHAKKKGRITHVFNLEFGLHLSTEEEGILPNQDEIVDMGEDPERSWKTTPEHARIGDRGGKSD
jgi:hypothetical protein